MSESKRVNVVLSVDWEAVYAVLKRQASTLPVNRQGG